MRRYETFIILDPELSAEQRAAAIEKVREIMGQMNGFLVKVDEWGSRRLAYPIRKKERGYYVRFDFCGTGKMVGEMERLFRIDERVLKYMTVLLDTEPDIDRIKEDMAKAADAEGQKQPVEITPAAAVAAPPAAADIAPAAAEPPPAVTAEPAQEA